MKHILVPVDFSPCSLAAAKAAIALAGIFKAQIFFLHISEDVGVGHVPRSRGVRSLSETQQQQLAKIRSGLAELVRQAERSGLRARQELVVKPTTEWIESYIDPFRIDMVVMGSQGAGNAKGIQFGSTTLRFIRHARVPVLVIKQPIEKFNIRRIVFASDFKRDFINSFQVVADLKVTCKSQLDLLYVCTPYHFVSTKTIISSMKRFMHQFKRIAYTPYVYNAITEERGIHDFALEGGSDLIAMTTEGRTGVMRMLKPSIAEGLVKHAALPLLILNTRLKKS